MVYRPKIQTKKKIAVKSDISKYKYKQYLQTLSDSDKPGA
jgi:hypothetical protein